METIWTESRIEEFIRSKVEESLTLDYKAAASLSSSPEKKKEITKDVSAMANSDGGLIIYGVAEFQEPNFEHLPEKIDPVDRKQFSKESLEQVIQGIRPRIDGLEIYPIPIAGVDTSVVYVVDVPKSKTAHQARDLKYYKRHNFNSVPMEDYEIRDVMNRGVEPNALVAFRLSIEPSLNNEPLYIHTLRATVKNTGLRTIARYKLEFTLPRIAPEVYPTTARGSYRLWDVYDEWQQLIKHRGAFRPNEVLFPEEEVAIGIQEMSPRCLWYTIPADGHDAWLESRRSSSNTLSWVLYIDDGPPKRGEIEFSQLYGK